jgi:hypothetical protein
MSCSFLVVTLSKYICFCFLPVSGVELVPGLYELFLLVTVMTLSKYICLVLPVPGVELAPGLYELFLLGGDLEYIFFGVTCPWR